MKIKITIGKLAVFAELNGSRTAKWIWNCLPVVSKTQLWGEEVYFNITPKIEIEKGCARDIVEPGDVAYWPQGPCMCLFFGMTPHSKPGEIKPASTVNVFGKIEGDPHILSTVKEGELVKVQRAAHG